MTYICVVNTVVKLINNTIIYLYYKINIILKLKIYILKKYYFIKKYFLQYIW